MTDERLSLVLEEAQIAGDAGQVRLCEMALAGDRQARAEVEASLPAFQARCGLDGWHVIDPGGSVWWPDDATAAVLEASATPEDDAVRICRTEPVRGKWHD